MNIDNNYEEKEITNYNDTDDYEELKSYRTPKYPDGIKCPRCGRESIYSEEYGSPLNYCHFCGQAINHNIRPKYESILDNMWRFLESAKIAGNKVKITALEESGIYGEMRISREEFADIASELRNADYCRKHKLNVLVPHYPEIDEEVLCECAPYGGGLIFHKVIVFKDKNSFDSFDENGTKCRILTWRYI